MERAVMVSPLLEDPSEEIEKESNGRDQKMEYRKRLRIEAFYSFLKTQYNLADHKQG